MDLQKFKAGISNWLENAKAQATVAPTKGQLLAWLLLVSITNVGFYQMSEFSTSCDFDRAERHLTEVEAKLDVLELKINNVNLYVMNPDFVQNDKDYRALADEYEKNLEQSFKNMKFISTKIEEVCDEGEWLQFWVYLISTFAALVLGWATLNVGSKPATKRKPKPNAKPSPRP